MSDEDSSGFNVVDRRTGAEDEEGSAAKPDEAAEGETAGQADSQSDSKQSASNPDAPGEDEPERGLPDPSFLLSMAALQMDARSLLSALIPIFDGFAWRSMGFLADPKTGDTATNLPEAQLAIDAVQFCMSKIDAQMAETERRDLQRRLSDLRMNYITKVREQ